MKEMSRNLLGAVTQSLHCGSPTQSTIFNQAIQCKLALKDLNFYSHDKSHNDAIWG